MYIERLPPPLLADIVNNRCLPVIGAGFSRNAILPAGYSMPLWTELGERIASRIHDYNFDNDPIDALSFYEHEYGRPRLVDELREALFVDAAVPGPAHRAFARVPFDVVCTTNADLLLERGYESEGRPYQVIVEEQQLPLGTAPGAVTLLKLHGDLNHPDRLVLTEGDYDGFISRNPLMVTFLTNLLITRTLLFIGYSLDDPDFRQISAMVADRLGSLRRRSYVITFGASPREVARYARRGVRCVELA